MPFLIKNRNNYDYPPLAVDNDLIYATVNIICPLDRSISKYTKNKLSDIEKKRYNFSLPGYGNIRNLSHIKSKLTKNESNKIRKKRLFNDEVFLTGILIKSLNKFDRSY